MSEWLLKYLSIEDAFQIKIKSTLAHKNQSYVQWRAISDNKRNKNKVRITITYYMGWHKRSYGWRYL